MTFYKSIEERLFYEEYEDASQEFGIVDFEMRDTSVEKVLRKTKLLSVNKNMLKLHRSDSMD